MTNASVVSGASLRSAAADERRDGGGGDGAALSIRGLKFAWPDAVASSGVEAGGGVGANVTRGRWTVDVGRLDIAPGEQVLLTAGSGRGKSTLLQLIAGLIEPTEGTVRVGGKDIHALRGAARDLLRGRTIGMIFQTFHLLHGFSAIENVMASLMFSTIPAKEHRDRAASLLRRLGVERVDADPDRLSVGQQQRVAVARAVACGPALVLADEPTASLDPENAAAAIDLIQSVCRERNAALLCVSHDPSMRERFARRESLEGLAGAADGSATR